MLILKCKESVHCTFIEIEDRLEVYKLVKKSNVLPTN